MKQQAGSKRLSTFARYVVSYMLVLLLALSALFLYMCMQPLFGMLSDRIGRRNNMLLFGGLGALATVPMGRLAARFITCSMRLKCSRIQVTSRLSAMATPAQEYSRYATTTSAITPTGTRIF